MIYSAKAETFSGRRSAGSRNQIVNNGISISMTTILIFIFVG